MTPKALCHDNSLAVMTTVAILAIECVLLVVDWGLERQKACRLPMGMDTAHKWSAEVLWMMVSLLLWHISRLEDTNTSASFNIQIQGTHPISVQGTHPISVQGTHPISVQGTHL